MSTKELAFAIDARTRMMRGIDVLANTVKVTLGPNGRNVVIEKPFGPPSSTKDGVTVANEIHLADPFENIGASLLRQVASRVDADAGDGTTTAIVLAQALAREGCNAVAVGLDPMEMRRQINAAIERVIEHIKKIAFPVSNWTDQMALALLASNGDREIAGMLVEAFAKAGTEGIISIHETQSLETAVELVDGLRLDQGLLSLHFATDPERMRCDLDNPYVLLVGKTLTNLPEILPLLELVARSQQSLLIVADDVTGDVLSTLLLNRIRHQLNVAAIKAPGFGEQRKVLMDDIAALVGTQVVRDEMGISLEHLSLQHLGRALRISVAENETILVGDTHRANAVSERSMQIRHQLELANSESERENLRARLMALSGGAVIHIGGISGAVVKERKERAEDALHAVRSALREGVVPGGGLALFGAAKALDHVDAKTAEARAALRAVRAALQAPLRQLAENAGYPSSFVASKLSEAAPTIGFDVVTGKYVDMVKAGILDPTLSVCAALRSAASISSLLVTTEVIVTNFVEADHDPYVLSAAD